MFLIAVFGKESYIRVWREDFGYDGPKNELDDLEKRYDSKKMKKIDKAIQIMINATDKCDFTSESQTGKQIAKSVLQGFQKCVVPIFNYFQNDSMRFFENWVNSSRKCDYIDEFRKLNVHGVANNEEIKWLIYPKCQEENHHVTLGVGRNINAERKLKKHQPNTRFYAVDPMIEVNYDLVTDQLNGSFFAFALANETKPQTFYVLIDDGTLKKKRLYVPRLVPTLDVAFFFEKLLQLKRIDSMFIDIEGGENYFLEYFKKDGKFDKIGLTICQFNFEFHNGHIGSHETEIHRLFRQTIEDERYIFMRASHHTPGFWKIYFLNIENRECVKKFFG
ncbi:unnamed protein product [Caenorhabditis angaria]|uniref:Methyltransferase FkbM domain-containing protein n=1 Tax=Caenorhabditis angaria TaxID=860376 RepID=A0A9P1IT30_9PELO|nr:unnamed protein product [Caenorhabditis angaria]